MLGSKRIWLNQAYSWEYEESQGLYGTFSSVNDSYHRVEQSNAAAMAHGSTHNRVEVDAKPFHLFLE